MNIALMTDPVASATALYTHPGYHAGWGPGFWFLIPLTFWLIIGLLLFTGWRRGRWGYRSRPEDALGEAFARGEIDEEQYRQRLAVIRETRRRQP